MIVHLSPTRHFYKRDVFASECMYLVTNKKIDHHTSKYERRNKAVMRGVKRNKARHDISAVGSQYDVRRTSPVKSYTTSNLC